MLLGDSSRLVNGLALLIAIVFTWGALSSLVSAVRLKAPPLLLVTLSLLTMACALYAWLLGGEAMNSSILVGVSGVIIQYFNTKYKRKGYLDTLKIPYVRIVVLFGT
jgi:hypothetical protein